MVNGKSPVLLEKKRIGLLCVIAIVAVLFGTLWPFNPWPVNKVTWLAEGNGVQIGHTGVVFSKGPLRLAGDSVAGKSCTLELLLRPASVEIPDAILGFYAPDSPTLLLIRQWAGDLLVTHNLVDAKGKIKRSKFDLNYVFQVGKLQLLTIASGSNGTTVYHDATRAQSFPKFRIDPSELSGQIVLGTSPVEYRPWFGEIHGLAIYSKELTPAEVSRDYTEWTTAHPARPSDAAGLVARYAFSERAGGEIHNDVATGPNLEIPAHFVIPHKEMLTSAAKEFELNRSYIDDVLLNIAGFVPLGMILGVYFSLTDPRGRAILYATLAGGCLSFSIEVLQAYIPRRVSGTTDIITNTVGALIGAAVARPDWIRNLMRAVRLLPAANRAGSSQD
jgi:hypothetical protein